jgi:hypothetical protein
LFSLFFLPFSLPPAGSTPPQQMEGSIITLQTSLLVSIWFIISVQIEDTNLSLLLWVLFSHFHPFHPLQAPLIDGWGGSIIPLRMSLAVFNRFIISIQIHDTNLSYGCRIILPCSNYSLLTFESLSLLVTVLYHHGFRREVNIYIDTHTSLYELYAAV